MSAAKKLTIEPVALITNADDDFLINESGMSVSVNTALVDPKSFSIKDNDSLVGGLWGTSNSVRLTGSVDNDIIINTNGVGDITVATESSGSITVNSPSISLTGDITINASTGGVDLNGGGNFTIDMPIALTNNAEIVSHMELNHSAIFTPSPGTSNPSSGWKVITDSSNGDLVAIHSSGVTRTLATP